MVIHEVRFDSTDEQSIMVVEILEGYVKYGLNLLTTKGIQCFKFSSKEPLLTDEVFTKFLNQCIVYNCEVKIYNHK